MKLNNELYILPPITDATIRMYRISENPEKFLESYLPHIDTPYQDFITLDEENKTYHVKYLETDDQWTSFDLLTIKGVTRPLDENENKNKNCTLIEFVFASGLYCFQIVYYRGMLLFKAIYDPDDDSDVEHITYKLLDNYNPNKWINFSIHKVFKVKTIQCLADLYKNTEMAVLDGPGLIIPSSIIVKITVESEYGQSNTYKFKETFGIPYMGMQIAVQNAEYRYMKLVELMNFNI